MKYKEGSKGAMQVEETSIQYNLSSLILQIREGLPFAELERLQKKLQVTADMIAEIVGISISTIKRKKKSGKLTQEQSAKIVRFTKIYNRAYAFFEDEESTREWLNSPLVALGGETPLHFSDTEFGAREVENLIGRMEHGVFS